MTGFLVVEDHPLFREALGDVVRDVMPDGDIFEAASIDDALNVLSSAHSVDLILLDLSMPGTTGPSGLIRIRKTFPKIPIVVVSVHEDPQIVAGILSLGISGYIPKSTSKQEIARSIVEVLRGSLYVPGRFRHIVGRPRGRCHNSQRLKRLHNMTPQQLRVLEMLHRGLQNKQIAHELNICETTVKVHVTEIMRKLNVFNRTMAIVEMSMVDFANLGRGTPTLLPSNIRSRLAIEP